MTRLFRHNHYVATDLSALRPPPRGKRLATTTLECVMAFTLLSSALMVSTPLIIKHKFLMHRQRDYRLALDEVSNQLDRLKAVPAEKQASAVAELALSEFTAARLNGAKLQGVFERLEDGHKVTLSIVWDEPQGTAAPVVLSAWMEAGPGPGAPQEGSRQP